ncbi:prephenate dehydrogenase/arogenate dehydrogenase family protein [bacterium]|nr:prephenate dehydrogenase/arogenate dehydrogenase family protein [bacterium]
MSDPQQELDELRQQVAHLDREILEKIAERLRTSRSIGEAKRRAGLPIRDFRVEASVMQRARQSASELGFDPGLAESVLESLIEAAVATQVAHQPVTHKGDLQRILILGGAGRMGAWLRQFLAGQGHTVASCDPSGGEFRDLASASAESWDVVVLSTPLAMLPETLGQALDLPGQPLIFDIGSLKSHLVADLQAAAAAGHRVTSLHPMFAPGTVILTGRSVLVCDAGNALATQQACDLFRETAVSLCPVPLDQHDQVMGALLGLSHTINLLFGQALKQLGLGFERLGPIASTTFAKQAKTAAEVAAENPELYHQIQHLNQCTPQVYEAMQTSLERLRGAALSPEAEPFLQLMGECRAYFFPSS